MTLKRRSGGAWTDIATTLKRKESGSWVDLDVIKRRLSGAWTTIWQRLTINNQSVSVSVGVTATAGYRLNTSGVAEKREQASYTTLETWLSSGTSSNYESRCTVNSGTLAGGTANTWESLGTSREWFIQ